MLFAVGNARRTGGGNWLTPHGEISVNADGDPLEGSEFSYSIAPRRLSIMVPGSR